jgi:hypothetical protein
VLEGQEREVRVAERGAQEQSEEGMKHGGYIGESGKQRVERDEGVKPKMWNF